jgi:[protein-PII] uridylyltransferase
VNDVVLAPPSPVQVRATLEARTTEIENRVRGVYLDTIRQQFPLGVALAATGGFGRAELFPHSDVDVLLIVESENQIPPVHGAMGAFLQNLWDAGLRPSHAVQTVSYCVAEHDGNTELTISLLDRRMLAGDPKMFEWLQERFAAFLAKRGASIAERLMRLTQARHAKFQNTMYHLEPNIKDAPGGLRDLQTVRWLNGLHRRGDPDDLSAAFDFLAAVRIRLHELSSRDQNVLSFDAQEALSDKPAALMRDYYRHARTVDRALTKTIETAPVPEGSLLGRFHEWRSRLSTPEFTVSRDRVLLREPKRLEGLAVFEFAARHQLRLAPDTIDRLAGFVPQTTWEDWKRLFSLPYASVGLRAMQTAGTLGAALPEWHHIECLVVRDFYHRYTVDEHTLVAIAALESIGDARFADLYGEIPDPWLVRFALLLHDVGKGSGRHVAESLRMAHEILERLGAPEADRATIEFLIEHHLDLSAVMTSRDLHDVATAKMLAARVGTVERLKQLAILTYADISAVNPEAMTPWRLEQLWQVYLLAYGEVTSELYTDRIHHAEGVSPERAAFLEGLPVRYLRTHSPAQIDGHFELARQLASRPVAIEITHERRIYHLTILTRDRSGLFASIAGAISSFGLSIVKAEAFSNTQGIVVDTFTFADPNRTLELNPPEVDRLRGIVRRVVEGKQSAAQLLRSRHRPLLPSRAARLNPRITVNNEASDTATLVEIVAEDRPGLLYDLAHAISSADCDIEVVLIDTEGHKALDVFYVTSLGRKLSLEHAGSLKNNLATACSAR